MASAVATPSSLDTDFKERLILKESTSTAPASQSQDVKAHLEFLDPAVTNPHVYTYSVDGKPSRNFTTIKGDVQVRDLRSAIDKADDPKEFSLDVAGFDFINDSTTKSWFSHELFDDEERVKKEYYPKVKEILETYFRKEYADTTDERLTLPKRIEIFDHTIRRNRPDWDNSLGKRKPVAVVHVDQSSGAGWRRFENVFREDDKKSGKLDPNDDTILPIDDESTYEQRLEQLKDRGHSRVALINVWRPLKDNVVDKPLSFARYRSINSNRVTDEEPGDMVKSDLIYPDFVGETYLIHHNPDQEWFYIPNQNTDEVTLLKCFDSLGEGDFDKVKKGELTRDEARISQFSPHTAFDNPLSTPEDTPRESIEVRTLVFF